MKARCFFRWLKAGIFHFGNVKGGAIKVVLDGDSARGGDGSERVRQSSAQNGISTSEPNHKMIARHGGTIVVVDYIVGRIANRKNHLLDQFL